MNTRKTVVENDIEMSGADASANLSPFSALTKHLQDAPDANYDETTTTTVTTANGSMDFMEMNVTAGVFMVLMVAVATAIVLCCCKAYKVCKQRRMRNSSNESYPTRNVNLSLPSGYRYSDEPPSYDDILSGKVPSSPTGGLRTVSSDVDDRKTSDEAIEVTWSTEDQDVDSLPPPLYSCVVMENENAEQVPSNQEPRSYTRSSASTNHNRPSSIQPQTPFTRQNEAKIFVSIIETVSAFVSSYRTNSTTNNSNQPSDV